MSSIESARRRERYRQLSGTLAHDTRRRIVRMLLEEDGAIGEAELAERLAAEASGSGEATDHLVAVLRIRLHQRHLPALVDNGLAHRDQAERTVTSTYHPIYKHHEPGDLVSADTVEPLARALGNERRRAVLASFETPGETSTRTTLVHRVAAVESAGPPEASHLDDVAIRLRHHHLPTLDAVGLVDYDREADALTYRGPPELTTVLDDRARSGDPPAAPLERPGGRVRPHSSATPRRRRTSPER